LRRSSHILTTAVLAALACGCGRRTLIAVGPDKCLDGGFARGVVGCPNPDPCADGGIGPNCPVSCTDGGIAIPGVAGCVPFVLLDGLVGYWRLDDGTGSTIASDVTGQNDGTLAELTAANPWVSGRSLGALNIAANGFVNVPRSESIDSIADKLTIAGWGYLVGATIMDYATIASREDGTTIDQHYHISINSRGEVPAMWLKTDGGIKLLQGPTAVMRQVWIHIAGTYDGTTARLYVNGQMVDTQPLTGRFVADTTPFILGANGNGVGDASVSERFPGRIDEVMLYRRALSADEIKMLYDGALFPSQFRTDAGARD
jgi:hypothetical protein